MRIDLPLDRLLLVLDQLGRGLLVSLQYLLTVNFRVRILTDNWAVVVWCSERQGFAVTCCDDTWIRDSNLLGCGITQDVVAGRFAAHWVAGPDGVVRVSILLRSRILIQRCRIVPDSRPIEKHRTFCCLIIRTEQSRWIWYLNITKCLHCHGASDVARELLDAGLLMAHIVVGVTALNHRLVEIIFATVKVSHLIAAISSSVVILLSHTSIHVEISTLLDRMVTTTFLLERDHLTYVWLLSRLNLLEPLANLVLLVLTLYNEIVKDLDRHIRLLRPITTSFSLLPHIIFLVDFF